MKTTEASRVEWLEDEITTFAAHLNAATARWLARLVEFRDLGGASGDDLGAWLAFRCGLSTREAREYLRVAEARGAAGDPRGLRARRAHLERGAGADPGRDTCLRGGAARARLLPHRLPARARAPRLPQDHGRAGAPEPRARVPRLLLGGGRLPRPARPPGSRGGDDPRARARCLPRAGWERRREQARARRQRAEAGAGDHFAPEVEPQRSASVQAMVELCRTALAAPAEKRSQERARLVVHVDALALERDGVGRCELEQGPLLAAETARRLACDAEMLTQIEQNGLPVSVGRRRRTVPAALRRLLEVRDAGTSSWPGASADRPAGTAPTALGTGRGDEPRKPRPPLLSPSPARARGRVHDRGRRSRRASLPHPLRRPLPEHPPLPAEGERRRPTGGTERSGVHDHSRDEPRRSGRAHGPRLRSGRTTRCYAIAAQPRVRGRARRPRRSRGTRCRKRRSRTSEPRPDTR